jgi:hypothetical protein
MFGMPAFVGERPACGAAKKCVGRVVGVLGFIGT